MPSDEWDGTNHGPSAPHWHDFKQIARDAWSFRFIDTGLAALETDTHRFHLKTDLVDDGPRTHRFWVVCYEPASADPEAEDVDERVPIHLGSGSTAIARNNILAARDSLADGDEHVLLVEEDGEEHAVHLPSACIADKAADEYTRIRMDTDRDVRAVVYSTDEWARKQEIERSLQGADDD